MKLAAWISIGLGTALGLAVASRAEEGPREPAQVPSQTTSALKFEDSVIEGVERKPLQGIDVIGNRGKDGKIHYLFKKRVDFEDKNADLIRDLRSAP